MSAILTQILDTVQVGVTSRSININNILLPVFQRKKVIKQALIDPSNQITIFGQRVVDSMRPFTFGDNWNVNYFIGIAIITPNNNDMVGNLAVYQQARQDIRNK